VTTRRLCDAVTAVSTIFVCVYEASSMHYRGSAVEACPGLEVNLFMLCMS